jgi:sialate O-acetylesterase
MSAICFLFGRRVHDETGVPMGLIAADWGGTLVEAWSSQEALDR